MIAYHMSPLIHPVGTILRGTAKPKVEPAVEEALERFRPRTCLDRLDSVYSRVKTDFAMLGLDSGYIYRVTIPEDSQRHDAVWLGQLQRARLKPKYARTFPNGVKGWPDWTDEFVATTSAKYWEGAASDQPLWELLSAKAKVEAQLSIVRIEAKATKGGWPQEGL